ncbi:MAG: hypothetical protein HRT65_09765 [Flavobacteriaceae bacterium]|nr:hypothetical protein [Flavobacteriaceae bacterium]
MLKKTNIEEKLARQRNDQQTEHNVLEEVRRILAADTALESAIAERLTRPSSVSGNAFNVDLLESGRIYHIDAIRDICIDYRLRFLNVKYFKGEIPASAISKIKHLEREHELTLQGFKIMAPSKLFKLEDKDDPLLFAPIGNGYYYLIHKWGNDLHPLRKLLVWPFKNIVNLMLTTLLISYLATLMVPNGLFTKAGGSTEFWIIFFFMFKSIAAVVIFFGFSLGKNFNPAIWNSKYFNV